MPVRKALQLDVTLPEILVVRFSFTILNVNALKTLHIYINTTAAGKNEASPTKTYGTSALSGGKTGGISDLTGGKSSSVSDLTGSKEGDKAVSSDDKKGGLFSGITGSKDEEGKKGGVFSGITGSKGDKGVSGLTGGKQGGISELTDNKWA